MSFDAVNPIINLFDHIDIFYTIDFNRITNIQDKYIIRIHYVGKIYKS